MSTFCQNSDLEGTWSWRIPFLIGAIMGIIILIMRQFLDESPAYVAAKKETPIPPKLLIRTYRNPLMATILLCGTAGGSYHLFFIFMVTFFGKMLPLTSLPEMQSLSTLCLEIYIGSLLMAAFLSDYTSPLRVIYLGLSVVIIGIINLIGNTGEGLINPLTWYGIACGLAFIHAPVFTLLFPHFHVLHRYRCLSMGHSVGSMLLSGTAPLLATSLWYQTQNPLLPLCLFLGLQILGTAGLSILGLSRKKHLMCLSCFFS